MLLRTYESAADLRFVQDAKVRPPPFGAFFSLPAFVSPSFPSRTSSPSSLTPSLCSYTSYRGRRARPHLPTSATTAPRPSDRMAHLLASVAAMDTLTVSSVARVWGRLRSERALRYRQELPLSGLPKTIQYCDLRQHQPILESVGIGLPTWSHTLAALALFFHSRWCLLVVVVVWVLSVIILSLRSATVLQLQCHRAVANPRR